MAANSTSDVCLKSDIESLPEMYDTLFVCLLPCGYKYLDGESNRFHTGFITHML